MEQKQPTGYPSIDKPWLKYYTPEQIEGAANVPIGKTIWDVLEERLQEDSDFPAIEYFGTRISRADFVRLVYRWAKAFKVLGVKEDEVVPVYGPNFPDMCAIFCALNLIGATAYFLRLAISEEALKQETGDSKIAVVFDDMLGNVGAVINAERFEKIILISALDYMPLSLKLAMKTKKLFSKKAPRSKTYIYAADALKLADAYPGGEVRAPFVKNRTAVITSSSGTSSGSSVKGIMATNEAAIAQLIQQVKYSDLDFPVGGKCLTNLPLTASTAMTCLFVHPLYQKVTVVLDPRLSEDEFCRQLMKYKP